MSDTTKALNAFAMAEYWEKQGNQQMANLWWELGRECLNEEESN